MKNDAALAAIKFALTDDDGSEAVTFLNLWLHGDFAAIRREWDNVPYEVFIGADPLIPAPTPPGVEPVLYVNGQSLEREDCPSTKSSQDEYFDTPLFTSQPSPKAEEVDPLKTEIERLRNAAKPVIDYWFEDDQNKTNHDHNMAFLELSNAYYRRATMADKGSPKAEWDAEGNPLNLMAAAKDAVKRLNTMIINYNLGRCYEGVKEVHDDLRKFTDQS